jgi:hypothetical protein
LLEPLLHALLKLRAHLLGALRVGLAAGFSGLLRRAEAVSKYGGAVAETCSLRAPEVVGEPRY